MGCCLASSASPRLRSEGVCMNGGLIGTCNHACRQDMQQQQQQSMLAQGMRTNLWEGVSTFASLTSRYAHMVHIHCCQQCKDGPRVSREEAPSHTTPKRIHAFHLPGSRPFRLLTWDQAVSLHAFSSRPGPHVDTGMRSKALTPFTLWRSRL